MCEDDEDFQSTLDKNLMSAVSLNCLKNRFMERAVYNGLLEFLCGGREGGSKGGREGGEKEGKRERGKEGE